MDVIGKFIPLIFTVIGAAMLISSIIKIKRCSSVTDGKVVDISPERTVNRGSIYPIIEYEVNGIKYVTSSDSTSNVSFLGQNKTIHYNPEKPEDSYVGSLIFIIIFSVIFIVGGIAFTVYT